MRRIVLAAGGTVAGLAMLLSAQSAKINAVSGATYTSGGYIQSLQSAIDKGA